MGWSYRVRPCGHAAADETTLSPMAVWPRHESAVWPASVAAVLHAETPQQAFSSLLFSVRPGSRNGEPHLRRQADQSPLTWDDSLAKAAQAWADAPASTAGGSLHHACC
ncbi:CAP domain-containing protein [Streptomyces mirabilis]|uniref:CAP domain-containing protein n=1 Tax=Streptomyces mirabilis TaxID=68239 RepID=UPI0033AAC047